MNYTIGDFLIRLKNASLAGSKTCEVPSTKFIKEVAKTLVGEGFLDAIEEVDKKLIMQIAYRKKEPLITNIRLISRPGLRVYMDVGEIEDKKGPSILIVSTSKGVVTSRQAVKKRLGGEIIAEIL